MVLWCAQDGAYYMLLAADDGRASTIGWNSFIGQAERRRCNLHEIKIEHCLVQTKGRGPSQLVAPYAEPQQRHLLLRQPKLLNEGVAYLLGVGL